MNFVCGNTRCRYPTAFLRKSKKQKYTYCTRCGIHRMYYNNIIIINDSEACTERVSDDKMIWSQHWQKCPSAHQCRKRSNETHTSEWNTIMISIDFPCVCVRFDLWTWPIGNKVNWTAEQQSANEINENRRLTISRIIINIQQQSICAHETTSTSLLNAIDLFCPRSQLFTFDVNRFVGRRRTHNVPHCVNASTMNQTN